MDFLQRIAVDVPRAGAGCLHLNSIRAAMTAERRFAINSQNVAHDLIDGEVIVVHFVNGNYFSLRDSAAWVWQRLAEGHSIAAITSHVQTVAPDLQPAVVADFVDQLVAEDLMAADESVQASAPLPQLDQFAAPALEKHVDMQELIAIDPIHEVSDSGWPHKA